MRPAREFANSLAEQVTMPEVYRGFRRLIAAPDSKINDYVDVIITDPALATKCIRIANTSFFGYPRKVNDLEQAISLIGVMQIHDVLISSLAMRAFAGIPDEIVNLAEYWENSVYCGIVSRIIAKKCMLPASQRFFALGLFHDTGHIVMYAKRPELAQEALRYSLEQDEPLFKVERKMFGFDYGQLGCELMRLWHLPKIFQEITEYHLEPEKAQLYSLETAIVHLAYTITQIQNDPGDVPIIQALVSPLAWELTTLDANDIQLIRAEAQKNVKEVLNVLWPFVDPPYNKDFVKKID
jgi:HD-like signal output (HDOD) protein